MFKVYDKVWVMRNNAPTELQVFAVIESAGYWKVDTENSYQLVDSMIGAGWGNNPGTRYMASSVYPTKEALVADLSK